MKKKSFSLIIILLAALCLIYPISTLVISKNGFLHWAILENANYRKMIVELIIWIGLMLAGIKQKNILWIFCVGILFSYLHLMLLPLVTAIIYVSFTILVGYFLNEVLLHLKKELVLYLFVGMMVLTVLYAIMSLLNVGGIKNLQIVDILLFVLSGFAFVKRNIGAFSVRKLFDKCSVSRETYIKIGTVAVFFMLNIGRANLSLDYDSLWYGLRPQYYLDVTKGIYENTKMVGCVYIYSKGFEIYSLPISNFVSYGFMYALNIILTCFVVYVVYKICRLFLDAEKSMWGMVFISAIPGIMNMSITAKSDNITLLIQVIAIYYILSFLNERDKEKCGIVFSLYIFSQTLKPTSAIFSTSIMMAFLFVLVVYRIFPKISLHSIFVVILSIMDISLVWLRTFLLTGIPSTSMWGIVFRKLGFEEKYPYNLEQFSSFRSGDIFSTEVIRETLGRIKEFFMAPQTEAGDHLIIAWGTTLCTFFSLLIILFILLNLKCVWKSVKEDMKLGMVLTLFLGELLGVFVTLWLLPTKPDGNYFMLYYSVSVITALIIMFYYAIPDYRLFKYVKFSILPAFIFCNFFFSGATTWAWTSEFNKIEFINRGYYNHKEEFKNYMNSLGCNKIFDIISEKPNNKLLAYGDLSVVDRFPCIVESELDVEHWGNRKLMEEPKSFLEFIYYEKYDYIYVAPDYISVNDNAYKNLEYLFEMGMVSDVLIEDNNILLTINYNNSKNNEKKYFSQFELFKKSIGND